MRSWLVVVLLATGCWSERAPAETTPPPIAARERPPEPWPARARSHVLRSHDDRCARAIAHVFDLARKDPIGTGLPPSMLDDLQEASIEGCHETAWSSEILGCYERMTSTEQMGECYRAMTEEQRDDAERRFMDIRLRHRSTPSPPLRPSSP